MPQEPRDASGLPAVAIAGAATPSEVAATVAERAESAALAPPVPLDRADPLFLPDDTRYPRPLFVRWLRALGQWCWVIVAGYPITGIFNLIGDVNASEPFTTHTAAQAFFLDRIVPAVLAQPLNAAPPVVAVVLLVLIARLCYLDHNRERAEIARRQRRD